MHTYRFVFRRPGYDRSFYCDFLAQNKASACKLWNAFSKTEIYKVTLLDIIRRD